jgi:ABC-2 type transport system ATP-binding protein
MTSVSEAHPIEFRNVVKRFGSRTVLNDLSFTVPQGSIVGLLGPNGAGKSTAMRVLLGLQRASSGSATILGHQAGTPGFRDAVRRVGSIIEAPPLYKNASAMSNLEIRAAAMGLSIRDSEIRGMINRVGLSTRADDKVGDFSLGMRQRMGIALALVADPSIVVLDEPTNGLDPEGAVEVRKLIKELPGRGATALVCTHRLAEIERTCDYVVVLRAGTLLRQGTLQEIISSATTAGLTVTVAPPDVQRAAAILQGLGLGDVAIAGDTLRLATPPPDPSVISRALGEQSIWLRQLRLEDATLEDAFLAITGEGAKS